MIAGTDIEERLLLTAQACRRALLEPPFPQVLSGLGPFSEPSAAFQTLSQITADAASVGTVRELCGGFPQNADVNVVERALLLLASQHAATQVPTLPVADRVKELFAEEFEFFASPTPSWIAHFRSDSVRFREMARIATLRRFPAGQFHWEVSGMPRSWVIQTPRVWTLLRHVFGRMGGFSPLFEFHINSRRKNRMVLLEKEANISYYRTAKSLERQPAVKGLMLASWLYCESTSEVSPHLAWLRAVPQSGGALAIDLGPVPADAGFLVGSEERRIKYQQGTYWPRTGCILWARKDLISWAERHPEFDQ
jgi:hypothetical protein